MLSFTKRATDNWTISFSEYQSGSYKRIYHNTTHQSEGFTAQHFESAGATHYGGTSDFVAGQTINSIQETNYGGSTARSVEVKDSTVTLSQTHGFDPPTYTQHFPSAAGPPSSASYDTTFTRDYVVNYTSQRGFSTDLAQTMGDTYFSTTKGTSISFSEVSAGDFTHTAPAPTATTTGSGTTYTGTATSSSYASKVDTAYYKDYTETDTNGFKTFYTTSSTTLSTTVSTDPTSTWDTAVSFSSDALTTIISNNGDDSNAQTYNADTTEYFTTLSGTSTVNATNHTGTGHSFDDILNTIVLLHCNLGTDFNLSGLLWTFHDSSFDVSSSTTGRFKDLYTSVDSQTITIPEYSKFSTVSVEQSGITLSIGTTVTSDSTGGTHTLQVTSSNGSYFPNRSSTTYDSTGGSHSFTLSPILTESSVRTFDLSGVGTLLSTFYTNTDHTPPVSSTTLFTISYQSSEYRRSDSSWHTGSSSSTWVSASSSTFAKNVLYQPATTTRIVSYPGSTQDDILYSAFSVTGTITSTLTDMTGGTTGVGTEAVYLGMKKTTTKRILSLKRIDTISTYVGSFHTDLYQYGSETNINSSTGTTATNSQPANSLKSSGTTESWADELHVTNYSEYRMGVSIHAKPVNYNASVANEAWFKHYPVGVAGFAGSFTASNLDVFRTTSQGVVAGSTFTTDQQIYLSDSAFAADGVSVYLIKADTPILGPQNASFISIPDNLATVVSIAATWTSETQTGPASSDTVVTSLAATHTLGVVDSISGDFYTAEAMTVDNSYRNELDGAFIGSVGFGLGQNIKQDSYEVRLEAGYAEWTAYSGQQSTAAVTGSTTGSNGSLTFSIPYSNAVIFRAENLLTANWEVGANGYNFFSSAPYIGFDPP